MAVSQASYDALPASLQRRATTVVHGVDLSRSDSLIARRAEIRALVRSELVVDARRAPVHDRGQPPAREGLRRAARRGQGDRGLRASHPHRRGGTRPVEHRAPRTSRRPGARGPLPVPRPARRRAAAVGGRRRLRPGLSPRGPARGADGSNQRRVAHCRQSRSAGCPRCSRTRSTPSWYHRATPALCSRP